MSVSMQLTNEAFRLKLMYGAAAPEVLTSLCSAKRDSAAFQIIVNSDKQYSLTAGIHDWYTERNHMFKKMRRLRVSVDSPFPVKTNLEEVLTDDDRTQKADILLAQETRESDANVPSAMWVEVNVPEDAKPGDYTIAIKLYSSDYNTDEELLDEQKVSLTVYDYVLPESKDWKFYLDLWQHNSNIARKHDVKLWSDEHFEVIKKYVSSLADLGQKSITVCASEIPWSGQDCCVNMRFKGNLYEYNIIGIEKELNGSFTYDYSNMQRYIDLCTEAGISGDIEIIGLVNVWVSKNMGTVSFCEDYPEAIRLRYLDKSDGCLKYMRNAEEIKAYIKALETYFISTNQIDRVRIGADEPGDIEKYRISVNLLRELTPSFRFKTANNHAEFIEEFGDCIDDYSPYIRCTSMEYDRLMNYKNSTEGKHFLWYVCCGNSTPNTFLRTAPIESRMIGLLTSFMKFDGFLRWNYTVWPEDPRNELRYGAFEAGDTNFVYPAYNGDVLLSLRYKNLQRGIVDFELLEQVRSLKGDEVADKLIEKVLYVTDINKYYEIMRTGTETMSHNWDQYNEIKAELLSILSK